MTPAPKRERTGVFKLLSEPTPDALPLAELEAALQERVGWADTLVSPFARTVPPADESTAAH